MRKVIAGAAALILLGGCETAPSKPTPPPPDGWGKATAVAEGAPQFTQITDICPALPAGLPVVKIQLTDVSPKKLGHQTGLFESNKDGTASTEKKLRDIPEVVFKGQNPTRLDIDASEFLTKAGDALLVELELADPAASFVPGPAAITAGNADGLAMFCIKDKASGINPKPGDRTARFYVRYLKSETPRYGKYNLFLLIKDGPYTTPIVLDPKVHNAG